MNAWTPLSTSAHLSWWKCFMNNRWTCTQSVIKLLVVCQEPLIGPKLCSLVCKHQALLWSDIYHCKQCLKEVLEGSTWTDRWYVSDFVYHWPWHKGMALPVISKHSHLQESAHPWRCTVLLAPRLVSNRKADERVLHAQTRNLFRYLFVITDMINKLFLPLYGSNKLQKTNLKLLKNHGLWGEVKLGSKWREVFNSVSSKVLRQVRNVQSSLSQSVLQIGSNF